MVHVKAASYMHVESELIKGLNPQQFRAVTTDHQGPVLVLAGAGCGKTTVLTRRIAWLAMQTCAPHKILALTFTRKAADEMAERIRHTAGICSRHDSPRITTFHAFALSLLRDSLKDVSNFSRLGYRGTPQLITPRQRLELLASITTSNERNSLGMDIGKLESVIACQEVQSLRDYTAVPQQKELLLRIQARLQSEKRMRGLWDFSDLIHEVLRLFVEFPDLKEQYGALFDHILVDEFQDTNPLQITFLESMGKAARRVFAVGDDDQAIYGFRGADITPMCRFEQLFPGACVMKLEINYRSTVRILAKANRIFRAKPALMRKFLLAGNTSAATRKGASPRMLQFQTQPHALREIMRLAQAVSSTDAIPLSSMALLFRVNQTRIWSCMFVQDEFKTTQAEMPQFLTVHGSKGLEFPVVFLCDLEEEIFPSYRPQRRIRWKHVGELLGWMFLGRYPVPPDCDIEEEKRLFYVGITRAQRYLFFVTILQKSHFGQHRRFKPSRFLKLL